MKLYILGKNTDDKGCQLEKLTKDILKEQGYKKICLSYISSGGSEIDIVAEQEQQVVSAKIINKVICECKAHNKPITMVDWLKFIGKIHVEKLSNDRVIGLLIALSDANGNVKGSYEDIKVKDKSNSIHLMNGDDILLLLEKKFMLAKTDAIEKYIKLLTDRLILSVELAYYNYTVFWIIGFEDNSYTVLQHDASPLSTENGTEIATLIKREISYHDFIDLEVEKAALERKAFIDKMVFSILMDSDDSISIEDLLSKYHQTKNKKNEVEILTSEIKEYLSCNIFIEELDGKFKIKNLDLDETVDFYKYIFSGFVPLHILSTKLYKQYINEALINRALEIQNHISIPDEKKKSFVFFLNYSPSALRYVLSPDPFIVNYRSPNGDTISVNIDNGHTQYYIQKITNLFISDYKNNDLSDYYFHECKIFSLHIEQHINIDQNGKSEIIIDNDETNRLGQLGPEYENKIILILDLPK